MRESEIEAYLVARVKDLGGEVRKVKWIGRRGAPDRLVMLPGIVRESARRPVVVTDRTIWVELKAPGVKPEPHQVREHERMRAMGQRVEVVDSLERVDEVLR
jgi:hypothetical protein